MKLIEDWRRVLKRAWSVRFMFLATAMGGLPILLDGLDEFVPPKVFLKLMVFANLAAFTSRFIKQDTPNA